MAGKNRRAFMKSSVVAGAAGLAVPAFAQNVRGANERIRIGLVGLGGRMHAHAAALSQMPNDVEIVAACDCDETRLGNFEKTYAGSLDPKRKYKKFIEQRELFADRDIDAVSFSTQDHWHALQTVWACQAGKDVYVEKPGTHTVAEGRKMVEAARKYKRMVQHGTQCRSSENIREGIRKLHEGIIGDVYMARGLACKIRGALGKYRPQPVPKGLDWDRWVGPARMMEYGDFLRTRWYWLDNFASGDIANQTVHQMDIIRWGLKLDEHPSLVMSTGDRITPGDTDDADTPNTQILAARWAGRKTIVQFEIRHWYTPSEAGLRDKYPFVQPDFLVGAIFFGTKGYMIIPDYSSYRVFFGLKCEPGPFAAEQGVPMKDLPHFQNWVKAIRSRNAADLHADIEQGHLSTAISHLAKISNKLGRSLRFDPKQERCVNDPDADAMLTKTYRPPYVMPAQV